MKNRILLRTTILSAIVFSCSQAFSTAADTAGRTDTVKEKIWALEEAYFANLYQADDMNGIIVKQRRFL